MEIGTATEHDTALPITPSGGEVETPSIRPDQLARIRQLQTRYTLIWTQPDPTDPDSLWMIEVVKKDGRLVSFAVQPTAEDALVTILEDLLPRTSRRSGAATPGQRTSRKPGERPRR